MCCGLGVPSLLWIVVMPDAVLLLESGHLNFDFLLKLQAVYKVFYCIILISSTKPWFIRYGFFSWVPVGNLDCETFKSKLLSFRCALHFKDLLLKCTWASLAVRVHCYAFSLFFHNNNFFQTLTTSISIILCKQDSVAPIQH